MHRKLHRPYKKALSHREIFEIMAKVDGRMKPDVNEWVGGINA